MRSSIRRAGSYACPTQETCNHLPICLLICKLVAVQNTWQLEFNKDHLNTLVSHLDADPNFQLVLYALYIFYHNYFTSSCFLSVSNWSVFYIYTVLLLCTLLFFSLHFVALNWVVWKWTQSLEAVSISFRNGYMELCYTPQIPRGQKYLRT